MLTTNSAEVLFPQELIPFEGVLRVISALRHPNRIHAKGIDCITGFSISVKQKGSINAWLPVKPDKKLWDSLNDVLVAMPTLAYPLPLRSIHEFLDEYVLRNWDIKYVPTFLSSQTLRWDIAQRVALFQFEFNELSSLFLSRKVELINQSRCILNEKTQMHLLRQPGVVFFTREEAVRYLRRKSYLKLALEIGTSWMDIVREPEIPNSFVDENGCCFGYPQMLQEDGIEVYRNWLRLQPPFKQRGDASDRLISKAGGSSLAAHSFELNVEQSSVFSLDASNSETCTDDQKMFDLNAGHQPVEMLASNEFRMDGSAAESNKHTICEVLPENATLTHSSKVRDMTMIGMAEVCNLSDYKRATIFSYMNNDSKYFDPDFPKSQKINGVNKWYKTEIEEWLILKMKRKPNN